MSRSKSKTRTAVRRIFTYSSAIPFGPKDAKENRFYFKLNCIGGSDIWLSRGWHFHGIETVLILWTFGRIANGQYYFDLYKCVDLWIYGLLAFRDRWISGLWTWGLPALIIWINIMNREVERLKVWKVKNSQWLLVEILLLIIYRLTPGQPSSDSSHMIFALPVSQLKFGNFKTF